MGIIYKLVFPNGKVYIGQTKNNIEKRISGHKTDSKRYNYPICNAINKYGIDNVKIEKLCEIPKEYMDNAEQYFIILFNSDNPLYGYNIETGGIKNKTRSKKIERNMYIPSKKIKQEFLNTTFNYLTVLDFAYKKRQLFFKCRCICGNELIVCGPDLKRGHTKSCGCFKIKIATNTIQNYNRKK